MARSPLGLAGEEGKEESLGLRGVIEVSRMLSASSPLMLFSFVRPPWLSTQPSVPQPRVSVPATALCPGLCASLCLCPRVPKSSVRTEHTCNSWVGEEQECLLV